MSYEEQFDRIIRRKVESAHYPFDEAHWEGARRQLDANRRKAAAAARTRWLWMAGAGAVVGIAVWTSVTFSGETHENILAEATKPAINVNTTPVIAESAEVAKVNNAPAPESVQPVTAKVNAVSVKKAAVIAAADLTDTGTEQSTNIAAPVGGKSEMAAATVANSDAANAPAEQNGPAAQPAETTNPGWAAEMETFESADLLRGLSLTLPFEQDDKEATTGLIAVSYEDYFRKNYRKQFLWAEAGSLYNSGWQAAGTRDAIGFNAFAGIGYGHYVSKRIALSAGLQAYHVSGIHQPFYKTAGKDYSFGSSPTSTAVTATDLVYTGIPVRVHYVFPGGAHLTAGVHTNFLVSAMNRVDTTSVQNDLVVTGTRTESGVYDGMNRTNVQISMAFAYPIARKWKLQGEYVHGVSDVFKIDQQLHGRETVNGIRVGVVYTIFDK